MESLGVAATGPSPLTGDRRAIFDSPNEFLARNSKETKEPISCPKPMKWFSRLSLGADPPFGKLRMKCAPEKQRTARWFFPDDSVRAGRTLQCQRSIGNLGFDEQRQLSERFLPTEVAHLGGDHGGHTGLLDV